MSNTANKEIRVRMFSEGLKQWQVANELGVCQSTVAVWLRNELENERKARIESAIDRLIERKNGE